MGAGVGVAVALDGQAMGWLEPKEVTEREEVVQGGVLVVPQQSCAALTKGTGQRAGGSGLAPMMMAAQSDMDYKCM